ncbi:MAG: hypothetical protein AAGH99_09135 [Planctomycetota bacterium]
MTTFSARCLPVLMFGVLLSALPLPPAHAIQPQTWTHSTEADFAAGEFDGVVVTNLGDLKLATSTSVLAELPESASLVFDLAKVGNTTLVAAGPEGMLLAVRDGEVVGSLEFEDQQVFSIAPLAETQTVAVALSGSASKVVVVELSGDELEVTDEQPLPEDVLYVWDIAFRGGGEELVLATGPEGKVLGVDKEGGVDELLDTAQANVLCLAEGPNGVIYAGTDTDGLVYRLDADGGAFVIYDADEPEIGALLVASDGSVYAGTANAEQARPGRLVAAAEEETGRPEAADETEPPVEDAAAAAEEPAEAETPDPEAEAVATIPEAAGPPSPEQLDALRAEVRKRLLAARESGKITTGGSSSTAARPTRNARPAATRNASNKNGNAVYRIDTQGFVREVFRESVAVLKLVELPDGKLLVGTGSEGQIYRIDPVRSETAVLNDLDAEQLLALMLDGDRVIVGGSNPATLIDLSKQTAAAGTYTSPVMDASQISLWGKLHVTTPTALAEGDRVVVKTRSGNVSDPEVAPWSEWSNGFVVQKNTASFEPFAPYPVDVLAPPGRYLQYQIILNADDRTTPVVSKVELAYVTPNLAPNLASLTATYPDFAGVDKPASAAMSVNWEATDDNGDRLLYNLEFKPAASTAGWLPLAENLADTSFEWDTRKVPDGRYQLRVSADDRLDNPGEMALTARRLADPILIDNTPPAAGNLAIDLDGRTARVSSVAVDTDSPIRSIAYTLDDAQEYTPVLPADLIYDSTTEAWSATLSDLSPGGHTLTVRTLDARGNATYTSTLFEVK